MQLPTPDGEHCTVKRTVSEQERVIDIILPASVCVRAVVR